MNELHFFKGLLNIDCCAVHSKRWLKSKFLTFFVLLVYSFILHSAWGRPAVHTPEREKNREKNWGMVLSINEKNAGHQTRTYQNFW